MYTSRICYGSARRQKISERLQQIEEVLRLFSSHKLVIFGRPILVVAFMPYDTRQTLFDELFCDVTLFSNSTSLSLVSFDKISFVSQMYIRVLSTILYCCTFPFIEITFARTNEIDVDLDVFADELFAQEFPGFLSVERLFRVRKSMFGGNS